MIFIRISANGKTWNFGINHNIREVGQRSVNFGTSSIDELMARDSRFTDLKKDLVEEKARQKKDMLKKFRTSGQASTKETKLNDKIGYSNVCPNHVDKNKDEELEIKIMIDLRSRIVNTFAVYPACNLNVHGYDSTTGLFPRPPCEEDSYKGTNDSTIYCTWYYTTRSQQRSDVSR